MIYAAIEPSGTYPRDVRPIGQTENWPFSLNCRDSLKPIRS